MLTATDIKNITFSKAMGGLKHEEVDVFLDKVEADYIQFEKIIKDYQEKIQDLEGQIESYKNSQNSIQNVLLNAQKLADQIVFEAKEKSEEIIKNAETNISVITAQEKELVSTFEANAKERKASLEIELQKMVDDANKKAECINKATADSVARQQVLFDKLKLEIAAFKSAITSKYKEHLSLLQDIPDSVQMDPKAMAKAISAKIDELPAVESFIDEKIVEAEPASEDLTSSLGLEIE